MKSFDEQLLTYKQQHSHKINQITHYIGIPAVIFSILMLFAWISIDIAQIWQIQFSWLLLAVSLVYYFLLNIRIAALMTIIMIPITFLAIIIARPTPTHISIILFLILFIGGFILQIVGHFFEKKKLVFFQNFTQLLIGPLYVIVNVLEALHIDSYFLRKK